MGSSPTGLLESLRHLIKRAKAYRDDASRDADKRKVMTFLLNEFFVANEESTISGRFAQFQTSYKKDIDAAFAWYKISVSKVFSQFWNELKLFASIYGSDKITADIMMQVTASPTPSPVVAKSAFHHIASQPVDIHSSKSKNYELLSGAGIGGTASLRSASAGSPKPPRG